MSGARAALRALDDGRHRAELYRMWHAGLSAGFTQPKSLETMGPRESPTAEEARLWLLRGTRAGRDVAFLASTGAHRFDDFERALLVLGDESGSLDRALVLLAELFTRRHRLNLWVRKQLAYPFFTLLAACFVAPLKLLIDGRTTAYLMLSFGGAAVLLAFAGTVIGVLNRRVGRRPPLVRARFARGLATAIEAGLPLPRAVRLAADASADPHVQQFVRGLDERSLATSHVSDSLRHCPHMSPDLLATLATAERTGDFGVLQRLAELYEDGFR